MAKQQPADFMAGVIEGFYGQPWTHAERFQLFDWMRRWGLNTYFYAPKDDLKHRVIWREPYTASEADALKVLIAGCHQRRLRFIYGIGPGLDIRYAKDTDREALKTRLRQMREIGCEHFALLFDDIPDRLDPEDLRQWKSLASAQCSVVNEICAWLRGSGCQGRLLFCPTPYCGRMAERKLGGEGYLAAVGAELLPEIGVFWTGPEIISREISVADARELERLLRRKPVLWDNLHANDYDARRFYCGPYSGRAPELPEAVGGILANPNNEFPLNYVPLRTLADYVRCEGEWRPRDAYLAALKEWSGSFETIKQPVSLKDLVLFCDSYYLPHLEGAEAESLFASAAQLCSLAPANWGHQTETFLRPARRLREFCARLAELRDRPLFYALNRRAWELREELDLLIGYVESKARSPDKPFHSDFHLPGTYRGGMAARLQRLLIPLDSGELQARAQRPNGSGARETASSPHSIP